MESGSSSGFVSFSLTRRVDKLQKEVKKHVTVENHVFFVYENTNEKQKGAEKQIKKTWQTHEKTILSDKTHANTWI